MVVLSWGVGYDNINDGGGLALICDTLIFMILIDLDD